MSSLLKRLALSGLITTAIVLYPYDFKTINAEDKKDYSFSDFGNVGKYESHSTITQMEIADVDGDGDLDIIVGIKRE